MTNPNSTTTPATRKRSYIRRLLGDLKWYFIGLWDDLRYQQAQRMRLNQRTAIESLPTVRWDGRSEIDVCMLCGHNQIDMGIAASWSLLRFAPDWQLVVFSDGTLLEADINKWKAIIPSLRVVEKKEADAAMDYRLVDFPMLRLVCSRNLFRSQLVDAHLAGESTFVLLLDSDVLCLQTPSELFDRAHSSTPCISWNSDRLNSYCAPKIKLEIVLECVLPNSVNAGVLLSPRMRHSHFAVMEDVLQRLATIMPDDEWMKHPWIAQTVYAVMATKLPGSSALSRDYAVSTRSSRPGVMRHYVSDPGIRARYFLDGINELLSQAASSKDLGAPELLTAD